MRRGFGSCIAIEGEHLVLSSQHKESQQSTLFTYHLDRTNDTWHHDGKLLPPGRASALSVHKGVLVATVNSGADEHREVCGVVYQLNKGEEGGDVWKELVTLKTNGVPKRGVEVSISVSVEGSMIYTGRVDYSPNGTGVVFVHDMSKTSKH